MNLYKLYSSIKDLEITKSTLNVRNIAIEKLINETEFIYVEEFNKKFNIYISENNKFKLVNSCKGNEILGKISNITGNYIVNNFKPYTFLELKELSKKLFITSDFHRDEEMSRTRILVLICDMLLFNRNSYHHDCGHSSHCSHSFRNDYDRDDER